MAYKANLVADQARRARFQEQCFLLFYRYHIRQALEFTTPGGARRQRNMNVHPTYAEVGSSTSVFNYDHIVTLNADRPDIIASQINALDGAEIFFNLDAAVLSQLKPIVELYKVYPNRKKTTTTKNALEVPFRIPLLLGEGITDNVEVAGEPSPMLQGADKGFSTIDDLFRMHNVLGNVMPHNFRIKFAGKDIAWVNAIDQFSFSLSFSSFRLFNHKFTDTDPNGDIVEWSYTDLISTSPRYSPTGKSLAPNINSTDYLPSSECPLDYSNVQGSAANPGTVTETKAIESNPNPDYFEIQAVIRYDSEIDWAMVDKLGSKYSPTDREKLQNFLRGSALVARLNFKEHTIRYSMGTSGGTNTELVLDLDYAAHLEGVLNSPDLDLLTLNEPDERDMQEIEKDLAYARRLAAEIRSKDLTLDEAVAGKTIEIEDTAFDNKYAKMYVKLRKNLMQRMGHYGQWLVRLPVDKNNKFLPMDQITVTTREIEIEKRRAFGGRLPRFHKGNPGMTKLEPPPGTKLPSNQTRADYSLAVRKHNAIVVFDELISQYESYIERKRSFYQQERYRGFFGALLGKGRIYKVNVDQKAVGVYQDDVTKSTPVVASARKGIGLSRQTWLQAVPGGNVEIAASDEDFFSKKIINEFVRVATNLHYGALKSGRGKEKIAMKQLGTKKKDSGYLGFKFESTNKKRMVYFTTFGDILDHAIDIATDTSIIRDDDLYGTWGPGLFKKRMGVLLGPLIDDSEIIAQSLVGSQFTRGKSFNLAHVPISMSLLMGWWLQNVVAKHRKVYTLHQFIRDLVKDLVAKMLGESCIEGAGNRSENVKIINFTSPMGPNKTRPGDVRRVPPFFPRGPLEGMTGDYPPGGDSRVYFKTSDGGLKLKGLRDWDRASFRDLPWSGKDDVAGKITKVGPNVPLEDQFNYMLIYVHSYNPKRLDPRKEQENIRKGIYYLHLGKMTSIIKSCTFNRMEIPYWREMKVAGQTSRTGATMLQDVYDARITLFGNNIFKVGSHVFVDPTKDGATDFDEWKRLGIGGFFLVTEVEHLLLHDGVTQETNLKLRYVTAGGCEKGEGIRTGALKVLTAKETKKLATDAANRAKGVK